MLDSSILQILRMFPRGSTDAQLLFRLGSGGMRSDPSAVLAALGLLVDRGEVWRDGDRWRVRDGVSALTPSAASPAAGGLRNPGGEILVAVPAMISDAQVRPAPPDSEGDGEAQVSWQAALSYYASTQRRDPRGHVERFPDQHGASWQMFSAHGRWWEGANLRMRADDLPGTFRQALSLAGLRGTAAVGWPLTVQLQPTGATFMPGLLLPATWVLDDATLTVTVDEVAPVLNPLWLRAIRANLAGRIDQFTEAILGSDEGANLGTVAPRLAHATGPLGGAALQPAHLAGEVSVSSNGLKNAAALFLPDEAAFTRRVAEDLDALAKWEPARRRATALASLLDGQIDGDTAGPTAPLVALSDLSDAQAAAAEAALAGPVTTIQGPPGTGKSQTIVALIVSAIASGQSVLFAARNHRALDEVQQRLATLFPDAPVLTRAMSADGEQNTTFLDAMRILSRETPGALPEALAVRGARETVLGRAAVAAAVRARRRERDAINLALSALTDRLVAFTSALPPGTRPRRPTLLERLRSWARRGKGNFDALADTATHHQIITRIADLHAALARIPEIPGDGDATVELADMRLIADAAARAEEGTIRHLSDRHADLSFAPGGAQIARLTPEDAALILRHRPVWAISSLSVPARVPLIPALFDLAIIDEASQADIASSLPVLARARRAVIVGDPEQLSFIPGLGRAQEHALMDAAGFPKAGRARWAQSVNSLFAFAAARLPAMRRHLLTDQFRSAPGIVDYTSEAFYGGRLTARRDDNAFLGPRDYRPGLHWEDVRGAALVADGGNVNVAEADWIANRLSTLASEAGFDGSVGIISPFNAQVALIRRRIAARLDAAAQERLRLHVDTVDRWQGGEADVVFFSMVAGHSAPPSAVNFLSGERRRFNVAISRARAVAVVVGDLDWARTCRIAHISALADRASNPRTRPQRSFDSLWERRVDTALRARGLDPHPQYPMGRKSLDFALFEGEIKLDLEVDGVRFHTGADGGRKTSDRLRDRELMGQGWKVRRFWIWELEQDMEGCLDTVERDLGRR